MNFDLPVKNGWQLEQISTRMFCLVERVWITLPQRQVIVVSSYFGWIDLWSAPSLTVALTPLAALPPIVFLVIGFPPGPVACFAMVLSLSFVYEALFMLLRKSLLVFVF